MFLFPLQWIYCRSGLMCEVYDGHGFGLCVSQSLLRNYKIHLNAVIAQLCGYNTPSIVAAQFSDKTQLRQKATSEAQQPQAVGCVCCEKWSVKTNWRYFSQQKCETEADWVQETAQQEVLIGCALVNVSHTPRHEHCEAQWSIQNKSNKHSDLKGISEFPRNH